MGKKEDYFTGSEYNGYIAHSCTPTVWIDRYGGGGAIDCYRLVLQTPYAPGISDAELDMCLRHDLSDVFPDIGVIGHNECNRRAFDGVEKYVPFGCRKQVMWSRGTCSVVLLLFDEFEGFPMPAHEPPQEDPADEDAYVDMLFASAPPEEFAD